ncbi:gene transfer agent family protein [Sphingorhabdus sp.]|uniref:gene transfer agent family protein n=1 Tax=Sphingorhabdus sp. TaxID=1902408 RepID=UPI00391A0A1B
MRRPANKMRGEASLSIEDGTFVLRPSFAALVAAEDELGPLFALVERAAAGDLKLSELVALFWHCHVDVGAGLTRAEFSESVAKAGLSATTPALKILLGQILSGR